MEVCKAVGAVNLFTLFLLQGVLPQTCFLVGDNEEAESCAYIHKFV